MLFSGGKDTTDPQMQWWQVSPLKSIWFLFVTFELDGQKRGLRASKVTANFCPKKIRAKIDDNILSQSAAVIFSMQS